MRLGLVVIFLHTASAQEYVQNSWNLTVRKTYFTLLPADTDLDGADGYGACNNLTTIQDENVCRWFATIQSYDFSESYSTWSPQGCHLTYHHTHVYEAPSIQVFFNFLPSSYGNHGGEAYSATFHRRRICANQAGFSPTASPTISPCARHYIVSFNFVEPALGNYEADVVPDAPGRFERVTDSATLPIELTALGNDYNFHLVWKRTSEMNVTYYMVKKTENDGGLGVGHWEIHDLYTNTSIFPLAKATSTGLCPNNYGDWYIRPKNWGDFSSGLAEPQLMWSSFSITEQTGSYIEPTFPPPSLSPTFSPPSLSPTFSPPTFPGPTASPSEQSNECKARYLVNFPLFHNTQHNTVGFPPEARGIYRKALDVPYPNSICDENRCRSTGPDAWVRTERNNSYFLYAILSYFGSEAQISNRNFVYRTWVLTKNHHTADPVHILHFTESKEWEKVDINSISSYTPFFPRKGFTCPDDMATAILDFGNPLSRCCPTLISIREVLPHDRDIPHSQYYSTPSPTLSPTVSPSTADRSFCEPDMAAGEQCPSSLQGSTGSSTKADIASGLVLAPVYAPGSTNGDTFYFCKEPRNTLAGATHHLCLGCDVYLFTDIIFKTRCKPFQCAAFQTHACDTNECETVDNACVDKCVSFKHIENIDDGHRVVIGIYFRHLPNPTVTGVGHQNLICSENVDQIMYIKVHSKIDNTETTQTYHDGMLQFSDFNATHHVNFEPAPAPPSPVPSPTISPTVYRPYTTIKYEETRDELRDLYLWLFVGVVSASVLYGAINSLKHCRGTVKVNSDATFVEKMYVVKDRNFF